MKTLDPADWNYRPIYDNGTDSDDYHTSKGFNYHNGPEWLWLVGFFFEAQIIFNWSESLPFVITHHLRPHKQLIQFSPWQGLPELTNRDGEPCSFSCPSQAWSSATILAMLCELRKKIDMSESK